jgi:hypothetical protein
LGRGRKRKKGGGKFKHTKEKVFHMASSSLLEPAIKLNPKDLIKVNCKLLNADHGLPSIRKNG